MANLSRLIVNHLAVDSGYVKIFYILTIRASVEVVLQNQPYLFVLSLWLDFILSLFLILSVAIKPLYLV